MSMGWHITLKMHEPRPDPSAFGLLPQYYNSLNETICKTNRRCLKFWNYCFMEDVMARGFLGAAIKIAKAAERAQRQALSVVAK